MSCLIKLFEPNSTSPPRHVDLTASTIELVAVDEGTKTNCTNVETNRFLPASTRHGANLAFTKTAIIYQVAVSDSASVYGGTTVMSLSGTTDGDLDVVLQKLPTSGITTTGLVTTAAQARQTVSAYLSWTSGEKWAILSTMNALTSLRGTVAPQLLRFISNYEFLLRDRGIDANLF